MKSLILFPASVFLFPIPDERFPVPDGSPPVPDENPLTKLIRKLNTRESERLCEMIERSGVNVSEQIRALLDEIIGNDEEWTPEREYVLKLIMYLGRVPSEAALKVLKNQKVITSLLQLARRGLMPSNDVLEGLGRMRKEVRLF